MSSLSQWRKSLPKKTSQAQIAGMLGITEAAYQGYESGRNPIDPIVQEKIKDMGYSGPWPKEEAKAPGGGDYVTRVEFDREVARLQTLLDDRTRMQERLAMRIERLSLIVQLLHPQEKEKYAHILPEKTP